MSHNAQGIRTNIKGATLFDPYNKEVAKGRVAGVDFVVKFGQNPLTTNGAWETVWDGSNLYPFPSASSGVTIESDSDFDDPDSGDGAQSVHIYGLASGTWALQDEIVAMSGTSVNNYIHIFRAEIDDVGGSGVNVGSVFIKMNAVSVAVIQPDEGQTLMAVYTIPSGTTGYLNRKEASVVADDSAQVKTADFRLRTRFPDKSWRTRDTIGLKDQAVNYLALYPMPVPEMTDITIEANAGTNTTKVTAGFDIELEDNNLGSKA